MKNPVVITFLLLLVSCGPHPVDEVDTTIVLQGVLVSGQPIEAIQLHTLNASDGSSHSSALSGAIVSLWRNGVHLQLEEDVDQPGHYKYGNEAVLVVAGDEYEIVANVLGHIVSAETTVPSELFNVVLSNANIEIDSQNGANDPAFTISVPGELGFETLLRLNTLESDPVVIPFGSGGGNFELSFALPQPFQDNGLYTVFTNDLTYYGSHRITVYRVSEDYSSAFSYNPIGSGVDVLNVPDNVEGGNGYFTSASAASSDLIVSEE